MKPVPCNEVDDWHVVEIKVGGMSLRGNFTILRVDRDTIPKELHAYDIRHGDEGDWSDMASIEYRVIVNHCGTFVTGKDLQLPEWGLNIDSYQYL